MKNWLQQMRQEEQSPGDQQPPFPQEDETKHQKQQGQQSQQQFQTKMVYQYPKQGNFRFPMIPDSQQKREPRQRNTDSKNEQSNRTQSQRSNYDSYKYSQAQQKKEWSKKDTYQPSSFEQGSPFTPSNVPSPIYGYGKREGHFSETVLDDLPSIMKKADEDDRLYESTLAKVLPETHPSKSMIPLTQEEEEELVSVSEDQVAEEVQEPEEDNVIGLFDHDEQNESTHEEESFSEQEQEDEDVPPTIIMYGSRDTESDSPDEEILSNEKVTDDSVVENEKGTEKDTPISESKNSHLPPSMLEMDESYEEEGVPLVDEEFAYQDEHVPEEKAVSDSEIGETTSGTEEEGANEGIAEYEAYSEEPETTSGEQLDNSSDLDDVYTVDETFDTDEVEESFNETVTFKDEAEEEQQSVDNFEFETNEAQSVNETPNMDGPEEMVTGQTLEEEPLKQTQESSFEERDTEETQEQPTNSKDESGAEEEVADTQVSDKEKVASEQTEPERPKRRSRPFNVIMTPRDKRHRDQQKAVTPTQPKQVEKSQKQEEVVEEEVEVKEKAPTQSTIPPYHLLNDPPKRMESEDEWIEEQMQLLETTLHNFHVKAKVVNAMKGPAVTRFEVQPEPGVKVSKITNLSDDIKMSLAAKDIRMEAPIPGKNAIGIEVPNQKSEAVGLQEILESEAFQGESSPLSVGLGLDIEGSPIVTDLKKMPHGLIAGATGSGKSVCINTILLSLLYKASHEDVKFLLIDPKMVELAPYNELPHLVAPVITDVKAATSALKWAVKEMEQRYERFVEEGVRDIDRYNDKIKAKGRLNDKMPYLVIVIDELADLMMMSPQDVEDAICRIAQKARACGIHLLLATQRPSVDVITGLIKANIPTRVAFSVSSQVDSRTIVDSAGAEKLLGRGDMLFLENGAGKTKRIQGAFVSDEEIERITNHVKKIASPNYLFEQEELMQQPNFEEAEDDLFEEAVQFVIDQNGASASLLQRRFKVGYNRAARLIDTMEEKGIISESKGSKPRDVYMDHAGFEELRRDHE
ncbi:DNA translocase FtsK [Pontibacillus sp. ALD_SL1]|uniref:DNA translocase FtsK n=1 Tax=Pontibacillus sp. ALD_SL1 TaxID=2777185 RepID=UPI001F6060EC|nr:DNA translocase FtsK [Pontibacillus sp. ALD_SL1]